MSGSISRHSFLEHFFIENHTEDECALQRLNLLRRQLKGGHEYLQLKYINKYSLLNNT